MLAEAEPYFKRAHSLQAQGDTHGAVEAWLSGIEIDPTHVPAHLALADGLFDLGMHDSAVIAARHALTVDPKSAAAYRRLGEAWEALGDYQEAAEAYSHCLALRSDSDAGCRLAVIRRMEGRLPEARALMEKVVRSEPKHAGHRFSLALVLSEQGARADAIEQLRRAIRLQPRFPEALNNLGSLLRTEQKFVEAETCFRKALFERPAYAAAWNNLANLCIELSRLDEAESCYSRAIDANQDYAEAHTSRAMLRMLQGNFKAGCEEYEWRWKQPGIRPAVFPCPAWDGSSIEGQTVFLYSEQGAGDTIQFIRYARQLKAQGASVILHCQESLRSLLEAMPELDCVLSGAEPAPPFDVHAPLMSLPRLCGSGLETIPSETPYLPVPQSPVIPEQLRQPGLPRVGLVWSGNSGHRNDRNRSCPPRLLEELLQTPGIRFFSLQVGGEPLSRPDSLFDLAPFLVDYAAAAVCLEHLDLLITVDTSVAHLAGALGRPVWVMLPSCNDWRWLVDRTDSPWYPSMRLFRQKKLEDWPALLAEVTTECQKWRNGTQATPTHLIAGNVIQPRTEPRPEEAVPINSSSPARLRDYGA